ncbi:MAG TPA: hypothetical protein VD741_05640 [Solirubrobacterales bacterium]|nr:hypothetical protein [Solirubrobacterales bacterium]
MSQADQVVRRSIGVVFSDGGLLALASSMPEGGRAHGDEEITAILCDPEGTPLTFEETLLSTEYGEDGVQRRVTLELWPSIEEMRPLRGAGTLISSVCVRRQGVDSQIAFFRWSIEGREGLGTYEIARSANG